MERLFNSISIEVYRSLICNNPDPIFLLDENGNILDTNSAAFEVFGYSLEECKEISYTNILIPDVDYDVRKLYAKTLRGESCAYPAKANHKNGNILYLQVKNVPMMHNQKLEGVMIVAKDVTDHFEMKMALQETTERLRSLFESSGDAIDLIDLEGNVLAVNSAFEDLYGWKAEEIIGKKMPTIPKDRLDAINERRERAKVGQSSKGLEVICLKKDGSSFVASITVSALHDENGKVMAFSGISRDISDEKLIEQALIRSEEKYRLMADNMTDLVAIIDKNGVFKYASPSHFPVLGYQPNIYEGTLAFDMVHSENLADVITRFIFLFENSGSATLEYRTKHITKGWVWLETTGTIFIDEENGEKFLLIVSREIEERKALQEKLKKMAFHDELTELPNRRLFQDRMQQTLKEAKRNNRKFALLYLDIDKFKWVNDHLGHSVGDELLQQFGKRVSTCLRENDTLARQGGDEFTILLPNVKEEGNVLMCVERIIESLQEEWMIGEQTFKTTSSIGIAYYPQDGTDMDQLFTSADKALYSAKRSGRNTYRTCSKGTEDHL